MGRTKILKIQGTREEREMILRLYKRSLADRLKNRKLKKCRYTLSDFIRERVLADDLSLNFKLNQLLQVVKNGETGNLSNKSK